MILLTATETKKILRQADDRKAELVEQKLIPMVTKALGAYYDDKATVLSVGRLFGMAVLGGAKYLRNVPQELIEGFGTNEDFAYTISDKIVEQFEKEFEAFVGSVSAIRIPWRSKIKPELLSAKSEKKESKAIAAKPKVKEVATSPKVVRAAQTPPAPAKVAPRAPAKPSQHRRHHGEDQDELSTHKKAGTDHSNGHSRLEKRVAMIEQLSGLHFDDVSKEQRFRTIVRPALKGIKRPSDTSRLLGLAADQGGMGLSRQKVAEVAGLLERLRAKDLEVAHRSQLQKKHEAQLPVPVDTKAQLPKKIEKQEGKKRIDTLIKQDVANQSFDFKAALKSKAKKPTVMPSRKMHDVAARPLTMGPVEVLRSLNLTDFRRLSPVPGTAVEKIKDKLGLLRKRGVDQFASGLKAYQDSPLYGIYVKTLHQSLSEDSQLDDAVSTTTDDPDRFTKEEFTAVMQLNRALQF